MKKDHPKRVPLNGVRQVMSVENMDPAFHYCWVSDVQVRGINQVELFKQAGYEFVIRTKDYDIQVGDPKLDKASQIGEKVSMPLGNGVMGYLMYVPNEIWEEELKILAQQADEQERAIYPDLSRDTSTYGEIRISTPNRRS